jgi:3-dehydroquinate dehydratase / shikimate dehydrogenase
MILPRPRICLSLFGSQSEIEEAIANHSNADLYEIRLDRSSNLDFDRLRHLTSGPLIFTAPARWDLLSTAAPYADYLDGGESPAVDPKFIVSYHGKEGDPEKLWRRIHDGRITKLVLETEDYGTIHKLVRLNSQHYPKGLCFAMGEPGNFSRILSVMAGAPWIYACLENRQTATGQFSIQKLIEVYRLHRFTAQPKVFGIVGNPVAHSRSPEYHNEQFAGLNLPWIYLPFLCKDLRGLFQHASQFGISGFSITHPFKEEVIDLLDSCTDEVHKLRSCNTVCLRNGSWEGINTDVEGISALLEQHQVTIADRRILVLGAGGAARAIASVVGRQASQLTILNRSAEKADQLAYEYGARAGTLAEFGKCSYDIVFQATSIGLRSSESPVDPSLIREGITAIDSIYDPPSTLFLQTARSKGCKTINGEAWFLAQAKAQLDWWRAKFSEEVDIEKA